MLSAELGGPVTACELIVKIDANLRYQRQSILPCGSYVDRCYKIFPSVGAEKTYWQLRPCKNYRLSQILKHKTKRRGRVSHCISSVQDYKSIVIVIVLFYCLSHLYPDRGINV